eukprot:TRINITY_DN2772_c0_g2_i5.p1 TRINITY_DN2772_c0_g2~~TRINITY_DN2772_c0_g2_i5.p1  ORF type:complete len:399 (-),score=102.13 TRINITY_DN2772_c0_g2_i5:421-1617(-)
MDAFLWIATIVIAVLLFIINIYLLAIYCHPDDNGFGASLICKFLVVFGLTLSWAQVLLLPLDVAASRGQTQAIEDMQVFWYVVYGAVAVMITVLLPFAIFYYESDDEKSMGQRVCSALGSEICMAIIVGLILFISWAFLNVAQIPVEIIVRDIADASNSAEAFNAIGLIQKQNSETLEIKVSFAVYVMALMSFFGWFLFVIFGGVGLTALPMDFIEGYTNRPKQRSRTEIDADKQKLRRKCQELIDLGKQVEIDKDNAKLADGWWSKRKANGNLQRMMNKFTSGVLSFEKEYMAYKAQIDYENTNPLVYLGKLLLGILCALVSFIWLLHILLFLIIKSDGYPLHTFLNKMLIGLEEGGAGFIATAIFAGFSLYLVWACQKGNIKFGLRIFLISIHPMK